MTFVIKDSGKRDTFTSGMVRDTADGKVDYSTLYYGPMIDRLAAHLTKAAETKYKDDPDGTPNWTKAAGLPELVRFRKSAARHFRQWMRGDIDEDHAAAVFFNINGYEYVKGKLDAERANDTMRVNATLRHLPGTNIHDLYSLAASDNSAPCEYCGLSAKT